MPDFLSDVTPEEIGEVQVNQESVEVICSNNCGLTTFEGGVSNTPVPPLDLCVTTATFINWLFLEGSNVGNWPSPDTIAYWIGGTQREVTFSPAVSSVSFFYVSVVPVTLEAFDVNDNLIASVTEPANFQGPLFDVWDPIGVDVGTNSIARIRVTGNDRQTGIDNFEVCRADECPVPNRLTCCQEVVEFDTQLVPPALIVESEGEDLTFQNVTVEIPESPVIEMVCPEKVIVCGRVRKTISYTAIADDGTPESRTFSTDVPFQCVIDREDANEGDEFIVDGYAVLCQGAPRGQNQGTRPDSTNPGSTVDVFWRFTEKDIIKVCIRKAENGF